MLVSVIIPNYNHSQYLKQRIDCVINQTYNEFEVIILDDCSTDNSKEIIELYKTNPKVSVINYNKTNSGSPFIQWAKGIELAKGRYIWIAESDDWSELSFLENIMIYAKEIPEACLLYCDTIFVTNGIEPNRHRRPNEEFILLQSEKLLKEKLINSLAINNASAVVFKKNKALPQLEELKKYKKHGDYFFWIQLAKEGSGVFVNKPLNYCRILDNSVTRLSWRKDLQSLKEHIQIFGILVPCIRTLTLKQKLHFYDCWGLVFVDMFSKIKEINISKTYYELVHSSNFSLYFSLRLLYFKLRLT